MDKKEILDLLQRMGAYRTEDGAVVIEPMRLIEDPIVTNRMCVDALQQLPANSKITMIVAADENGQYLGYSAATTAWARFGVFSAYNGGLNKCAQLKKNDKVIICLDTLESESLNHI
ncbi:MAG: hypothetical protein ACI4BI_03075 [Anaerotardibacter sp.]